MAEVPEAPAPYPAILHAGFLMRIPVTRQAGTYGERALLLPLTQLAQQFHLVRS